MNEHNKALMLNIVSKREKFHKLNPDNTAIIYSQQINFTQKRKPQ